ncbi:PaaI family thioesterase [Cupriavidus necator]|uniref:PaaI family thioesterase n=1 Tax=Cupriavidus necator TaxID=106590 RepID=UPI0005B31735|nr:PaaI family thioesterase [Cupriavidus necator]
MRLDTDVVADNPDRALIHELVGAASHNVPLRTNPALEALQALLVQGSPGAITLRFSATARSVQGNGVIAGGMLTSMLDFGMAFAILSKLPKGKTCATISLTVNMQSPAQTGDFLVDANATRVGGRVAFVRAELYDAERTRLIADAVASFAVLDVR